MVCREALRSLTIDDRDEIMPPASHSAWLMAVRVCCALTPNHSILLIFNRGVNIQDQTFEILSNFHIYMSFTWDQDFLPRKAMLDAILRCTIGNYPEQATTDPQVIHAIIQETGHYPMWLAVRRYEMHCCCAEMELSVSKAFFVGCQVCQLIAHPRYDFMSQAAHSITT